MANGKWHKIEYLLILIKSTTNLFSSDTLCFNLTFIAGPEEKKTVRICSSSPRNKCRVTRNLGFTLVELSIILVIIGLIIGGVLVGRDLIEASKIRSQTQQILDIETQMNTFKLKYNCTAGDCVNATSFFGTTDARGNTVNNGDGDGIVKAIYGAGGGSVYGAGECLNPDISGEISQLFLHLGNAGLGDYSKGTLVAGVGLIGREYPYAKYGSCKKNR